MLTQLTNSFLPWCESSLEDRQREGPSTGAPALLTIMGAATICALAPLFLVSELFFFFAYLRRFFLRFFNSLSIGRWIGTVLTTRFGGAAPCPSLLLSYGATNSWYSANWFTVTTSEWTFDILVLADDSLQLDEWIWTETWFISRALSCLCLSRNSRK